MTTYTPLNFTQTIRDDVLIVDLRGAIDSALSLDGLADTAIRNPAANVVLVLAGVDYINSAGFSALIRFSDAVTFGAKSLYIVGLESKVHVVFQSLGAHSIFNILPTLDDALARISAPPPAP